MAGLRLVSKQMMLYLQQLGWVKAAHEAAETWQRLCPRLLKFCFHYCLDT